MEKTKSKREKPGAKGSGEYFRIIVRPKEQFTTFRNQDVGEPGGLQRVAGQKRNGSWQTQAWLVSKEHAHIEGDKLVADSQDARELLEQLAGEPSHEKGDIFISKDRPDVPEKHKPTDAQKRASRKNIKRAQEARSHKAM